MGRLGKLSILTVTIAASLSAKSEPIDSYIVVMKKAPAFTTDQFTTDSVNSLADRFRLRIRRGFRILRGGSYDMTAAQASRVAADPQVAYVEKDHIIHVNATTQSNATWGLDRLDQPKLPLDQSYSFPTGGAAVNAYVIDTGILTSHQEFGGRAVSGIDIVDSDSDATDCNGHGTHVAGTIGGKTYGVAKSVKLYGVRVLDCEGSGSFSDVIAGIEWVSANHVKPAVANMSLGGPASQAVDDAVKAAIENGVTFVVAAGNENSDACGGSPSRVPLALTVGATTKADARASFSNYGSCVDLFAPGQDITSSWYANPSATNTISGTSMAAPHAVGVAALYLAQHPAAAPAEVAQALVAGSLSGAVSNPGSGSPNKLLNIAFLSGGGGGGEEPPASQLKNNVPVSNLKGDKGSTVYFSVEVPAGMKSLKVSLSGGSGDADLYVKRAEKPTTSSYDCRPYRSGNNEACTLSNPKVAVYHVMLRGYSSYSGASLKAQYSQ